MVPLRKYKEESQNYTVARDYPILIPRTQYEPLQSLYRKNSTNRLRFPHLKKVIITAGHHVKNHTFNPVRWPVRLRLTVLLDSGLRQSLGGSPEYPNINLA